MKKTLSYIGYGIFTLLLTAVAGLFLMSMLPISLPGQAGNLELKIVRSGSMEPSIPVGAVVAIIPSREYTPGDVITFGADTSREIPTTHRIVSVRTEGGVTFYTTKGDANEEADPNEVRGGEVIGKVLFSLPYAGFILDFARQPLGFALLIGLPAALIILDEAFNLFQEFRGLRRRKKKAPTDLSQDETLLEESREFMYVRERVSDDMFVHRRVPVPPKASQTKFRFKPQWAIFAMLLLVPGVIALGSIGSTFSYFSDEEGSLGNLIGAGEWPSVFSARLAENARMLFLLSEAPLGLSEEDEEVADDEPKEEEPIQESSPGEIVAPKEENRDLEEETPQEDQEEKQGVDEEPKADVEEPGEAESQEDGDATAPPQEPTPPTPPSPPSPPELPVVDETPPEPPLVEETTPAPPPPPETPPPPPAETPAPAPDTPPATE